MATSFFSDCSDENGRRALSPPPDHATALARVNVPIHLIFGIGYAVAAGCAAVAWQRSRTSEPKNSSLPRTWMIVTWTLAAMVLFRLTDAIGAIGDTIRELARTEGWYEARRPVQVMGAIAIVAAAIWVVATAMRRSARSDSVEGVVIVALMATLLCLAAVRTVSLHQADSVLQRSQVLGMSLGNLFEAIGLLSIAVVAVRSATAPRRRESAA